LPGDLILNVVLILIFSISSLPIVQPIDVDFKEQTVTAIVHHDQTNQWGIVQRSAQGEDLKLYFVSRSPIYQPALAFDRSYLAFLVAGQAVEAATPETGGIISARDTGQALVIMNEKLHITATFPDVRAYCWSPYNYKLIAINGRYAEGGLGYESRMVFMYDPWQQMGITLYIQAEKAFWARQDERVYLYSAGTPVRAHDPYKNTTADTHFQGINIAPGGRFYYADFPGRDFNLFDAQTHKAVVLQTDPGKDRLSPMGWLDAPDPILVLRESVKNRTVIYSVRTGKYITKPWLPLAPRGGYLPAEFVDGARPVRLDEADWQSLTE